MRSKAECLAYIDSRYPWLAKNFAGANKLRLLAIDVLFVKEEATDDDSNRRDV